MHEILTFNKVQVSKKSSIWRELCNFNTRVHNSCIKVNDYMKEHFSGDNTMIVETEIQFRRFNDDCSVGEANKNL